MRELDLSTSFKKDLKLSKRRGKDLDKLYAIIELLRSGQSLPARLRDHALTGVHRGCRDCHVEPDWVLIYSMSDTLLRLIRLGSHSDIL